MAAHAAAGRGAAAGGSGGSNGASSTSGGSGGEAGAAGKGLGAVGVTPADAVGGVAAEGVPPPLRLVAREQPNLTYGRAWAKVWRGPEHLFFGHDAKR